jgi:hypothetical protein
MITNQKQDKTFYVGLTISLVLSTAIAVFAQSMGEAASQERWTNPASYSEAA